MKDLVFVGEHFFYGRRIGREEHLSRQSNNYPGTGEKYHLFYLPDDRHFVRPDKDSDSAEELLLCEDTLLNNSAAGYAGGIVTPCLPELTVDLDFALM